ncbi:calcium/calmodulin-dependent protein kinase type 1 [Aphelenchoides avenae]|nr:calcium/calmodulin-dependent protein kinase type 1 [Aphelenchus avenae]
MTVLSNGFAKHIDIDVEKKIEPTRFTVGDAVALMNGTDRGWDELISTHVLKDVTVHPIAIGFLSFVAKINFHFEGLPDPFSVILKVPTADNMAQLNNNLSDEYLEDFAATLAESHDREIYLYENLKKIPKNFGLPKVFAWKACPEGRRNRAGLMETYMLMEDLGLHGAMPDIVTGMSKGQIETVIRAIAEFHATSLTLPNRDELFKIIRPSRSIAKENFDLVIGNLPNMHETFKRHRDLLMEIDRNNEIIMFDAHVPFGTPPVLCHGDFWANNFFFEKNPDGTPSEKLYAILDWQLAHPGNGMVDFCRLVFNCANASMKLRHINEWLRLYYDAFHDTCHSLGIKCPYKWETVQRMYHYQCPSELLFNFMLLSTYYQKVPHEGLRTSFLARMVSNFEMVRKNMGW